MADSIQVTVSGTVGKQVFATNKRTILKGLILVSPSGVAGSVVVRDGNASGEVKASLTNHTLMPTSKFPCSKGIRFDKGVHVKVLGTNSVAYLIIE